MTAYQLGEEDWWQGHRNGWSWTDKRRKVSVKGDNLTEESVKTKAAFFGDLSGLFVTEDGKTAKIRYASHKGAAAAVNGWIGNGQSAAFDD
eukprot:s364_g6.t1